MKNYRYIILSIILFISIAIPAAAQAPQQGDGNAAGGQGFQGRRGMMNIDPEQMQKMISDGLKQQLEISDDEWTVIGPKVMNILSFSMQTRVGGSMRMFMGRSGRPGGQGGADTQDRRRNRMPGMFGESAADDGMPELQKLLEDKNADPKMIKQQVTKVRKAKEKSQRELASAKKELRELLTVRQEAILISMGLLD